MENRASRGRATGSRGRGRQNAENPNRNPNRSQNPWSQNRNFQENLPHPAPPPRANTPTTVNPVQSPVVNAWQNPGVPIPTYSAPPRGNPWRPRGNPVQNPVANSFQDPAVPVQSYLATPRVNAWQNPGSGVGRAGGSRAEYMPKSVNTDPIPSISEPPSQELHQLQISSTQSTSPSEVVGRAPIRRPDGGGRDAIRKVGLLVNHFKVSYNSTRIILHYDIDIQLEKPPMPNAAIRISKSDALMIRNKLFSEDLSRFPLSKTVCDGEKNIFSAVELPTGKFTVSISKGEDMKPRTYVISINLVNRLELSILEAYFKRCGQSVPRDILQGMDIVMRENPSRTRITMGRGFFSKNPSLNCDIGDGILGAQGFLQSLKPTSQGLALCIDYTVMPFRKPVPVLDFLGEHLDISFDVRMSLDNHQRRIVERALKGLKVTVTHRKTSQKSKVMGLTKLNTSHITFEVENPNDANSNTKVGLVKYFVDKYGRDIKYKNLPCLDLSTSKRMNYVPMEFCVLVEGQRYPKDGLSSYADQKLRQMSLVSPVERKRQICEVVKANDGPCGGDIAKQFGITVSMKMTEVEGRILSPPALKLRNTASQYSSLTPQGNCQWNLLNNKFLDGKVIKRWGILDFSQLRCGHRYSPLDIDKFTYAFVQHSRSLGIGMENCLFYEGASMNDLSDPKALYNLLKYVYNELAEGHLQILICPMAEKHEGYKTLKRICETEIGIMSQCCLSYPANKSCLTFLAKKRQDQYLVNLALKINAKVGGSNMELYHRLPRLEGDGHVMFMGADVNHPTGYNALSPSITSVVATMNWPSANRYASRLHAQPRGEKILDIGKMCFELLESYALINKVKPKKIIFFRDGVSESQFDMVLNEELTEIKKAIEYDGYSPTITLVVAQKRHQTRLFPMNEMDAGKSGNVAPGTVVDKTVTHQEEFDFYLNSHYGSLGTSKPTHYHVLSDDNGFFSDELQRIIYNLCYTFPRCTKPISLVPPVYYADLVAYRGRMYYESLTASSSSSSSSSTWSVSSSSATSISFPKVHNDLENQMFCI